MLFHVPTFPDCVMVAPQILVLIVGVRILLGELKLNQSVQLFLYAAVIGPFVYRLGRDPLKVERRVRFP